MGGGGQCRRRCRYRCRSRRDRDLGFRAVPQGVGQAIAAGHGRSHRCSQEQLLRRFALTGVVTDDDGTRLGRRGRDFVENDRFGDKGRGK